MKSRLTPVFVAAVLLLSKGVLAQPAQVDARGSSLVLFQEAEKLAAAGDAAAACRKYGESYSLDPQLDALLRWADCLEQGGKLASAYLALRDAVQLAQHARDARSAAAEARANALRPRLSYLTIAVPPGRVVPALVVERDGFRLGSSAWGVPLPIDPGTHTLSASAQGYLPWSATVEVVGDAAAPFVEVPLLERAPPEAVAVVAPPPVAPAPGTQATPGEPSPVVTSSAAPGADADRAPSRTASAVRIVAPILVGVGVVSTVAGFYFWSETKSTLDERDGICPTGRDCAPGTNARLANLTSQAVTSQRSEIICFALGGTAAAIGVGLWLLPAGDRGQKRARARLLTPVVQPGGGGLLLQGEL